MRNTFGNIFTLTSFGESHGTAVGGIVDGFPAGIDIDLEFIQNELKRRKPGQSKITTDRKEPDQVEFVAYLRVNQQVPPLLSKCVILINTLKTMIICAKSLDPLMQISPIIINMV